MGATLAFFSPLANQPVPPEADALYLPGGYPELHAWALSTATVWRASVRAAHAQGMPILAECGGMMALADTLADQNGVVWPMAGLLQGQAAMQERLAGLGPQALETPHGTLRGHTFHYSALKTDAVPLAHTVKHPGGAPGEALYRIGSLSASYFHAYFASCPAATAAMFSRSARP
jgi:cobyrinic acid a,c-diamide synthase